MVTGRRVAFIVIVVGVIWVAASFVSSMQQNNWYQPRITQARVRQEIRRGLPMGSTVAQTIAFLAARGWIDPHNVGMYRNRNSFSSDGFEQKDPSGSTLLASIPDAYPGLFSSGGIYMKFGFNDRGHLTRYELQDVYTGL